MPANLEIFAPVSYRSLEAMIDYSISSDKPIAIRYPNSSELSSALSELSEIDRFILTDFSEQSPPQYVVITYGAIAKNVLDAKRMLIEKNVKIGTVVLERLKPYRPTAKRLFNILSGAKGILFVEEGIRYGGASEILLAELIEAGLDTSVTHVAISAVDDSFAIPDSPTDLYDYVGLSPNKISEKILNL